MEDLGVLGADIVTAPAWINNNGRRPALSWPREIPIDGVPETVVRVSQTYADFMAKSPTPSSSLMPSLGQFLRAGCANSAGGQPTRDRRGSVPLRSHLARDVGTEDNEPAPQMRFAE